MTTAAAMFAGVPLALGVQSHGLVERI